MERLSEHLAAKYDLGHEIARGGMAIVYRARERTLDREVAIKVLREELSSAPDRVRFAHEIEIESGLQHPNILPVLDWGEAGGASYYVMPFVDGESLKDRIEREGPLPVADAIEIIRQIANGLAHAHGCGIIHRDLKPGNILLSSRSAVLTDFGIARALDVVDGRYMTSTGVVVGTPTYMSPEQGSGDGDVGPRSDIYALACVLFETLSGEPPFTGRTAQAIIARHVLERVPSLQVVRPGLPRSVVYAVERGMAKTPADRFATIEEFRDALTGATPAPIDGTDSARSRRRRFTGIASVGGLATVGLLAIALLQGGEQAPLDDFLVVGFPLVSVGEGMMSTALGEIVALGIGSALEVAEPLRWIDGWSWMEPDEREDVRRLTAERADSISRARAARYRIEGRVVMGADSGTVILTLFDVARQVELDRRTERGEASETAMIRAAIRGTVELLPRLLEPGREVDLSGLLDRDPGAVALLLLGNREYRSSRFESSLTFHERALGADPLLIEAALRAASAASWLDRGGDARRFTELALEGRAHLNDRQASFAEGLAAYLDGRADAALEHLRLAARGAPDWPDPHFAVGEVYRHLLPRGGDAHAEAADAYGAAILADPEYTPALFHLVEAELWAGDTETAGRYYARLERAGAASPRLRQLELMLQCARADIDAATWAVEVAERPSVVLEASYSLLPAPAYAGCARDGLHAIVGSDEALLMRWDALLALHSLLVAEGSGSAAKSVVDEAIQSGISLAYGLYVIGALTGAPTEVEARAFLDQLGEDYQTRGTQGLWLEAQWAAHRGEVETLSLVTAALQARTQASAGETGGVDDAIRRDRLFTDAAAARLAALRGDTAEALERFERLRPTARRPDISWTLWESLGFERLAYAELLLASGRAGDAEEVAAELDRAAPVIYRALQPASLELRMRAAEARGDAAASTRYRERLKAIRDAAGAHDGR